MRFYDRASALFWLAFSVAVFIQSLRIGIGTLNNPGMGFITFGASGIMGILSIILFFQSLRGTGETEEMVSPFSGLLLSRVFSVLGVIFVYIILLKTLGYLIDTFLLMASLFFITGLRTWWQFIPFSAFTSLVSYYLFFKIFNCPLPQGILSF